MRDEAADIEVMHFDDNGFLQTYTHAKYADFIRWRFVGLKRCHHQDIYRKPDRVGRMQNR